MKIFALFTLVLTILPLGARNAEAKTQGSYRVSITGENSQGKWTDVITALGGWSCYARSSLTFQEELFDHRGRPKMVPQKQEHRYSYSFFSKPSVSMQFDRDMAIDANQLSSQITEHCSKTVWETCEEQDCDSRGCRTVTSTCSRTKTADFTWNCQFSYLPGEAGESNRSVCSPSTSTWSMSFEGLFLGALRKKEVNAEIRLEKVENVLAADFCTGAPGENRKILRITQGTGKHMGENDFVFKVRVGDHETKITTESGLLNHDIAYCGPLPVPVHVEAIEDDLIFDDHYIPQNDVALGDGNLRDSIQLKRKTYFWSLFTDRDHEVVVKLTNQTGPVAPPAPTDVPPRNDRSRSAY